MHSSIELPPIQNHINQQSMPPFHSPRPRELLPSMMAHSPPGRSSTLPPLQRKESIKRNKPARPRKSSITENSRKPKHEKKTSKDFSSFSRRMSLEGRKAFSAEPPGAREAFMGKRWEDLVEAAASATEADSDRDLTPARPTFAPSFLEICLPRHRYRSLPPQSSAPPSHHFPPSPTTNPTKPRPSEMLSRLHPHTLLQDQPPFPPLKPPSTLPTRPNHPATIFTYPLLVSQTPPTPPHLPFMLGASPCRYIVPGAGG